MTQRQLTEFSKLLGQYMEEQLAAAAVNEDAKRNNDWANITSGIKAQYNHARLIKRKIDVLVAQEIKT